MSAHALGTGDALLNHLLNELDQRPDIAKIKMSGKDTDTVQVIRAFLSEVPPPHGRTHFIQYAIVWLSKNHATDAICLAPTQEEYRVALEDQKGYRDEHHQTKRKVLRCLARLGEHLILRTIYRVMGRPGAGSSSSESSSSRSTRQRQDCLRRDGHRCVITGAFHYTEALARVDQGIHTDDDGNPMGSNFADFVTLEVAHILPHSLGWRDSMSEASDTVRPRLNVYTILDMFCPGTMSMYHGSRIELPENCMALTHEMHIRFDELHIYFEPKEGVPNTYTVRNALPVLPSMSMFPKDITFRSSTNVKLPDPNLLAIHRACARIAYATGAGESALQFFQDFEDGEVRADGSTALGHLVTDRLAFNQGVSQSHQGEQLHELRAR